MREIDDVMGAILGTALLGGTFGDVGSGTLRDRARMMLIKWKNRSLLSLLSSF